MIPFVFHRNFTDHSLTVHSLKPQWKYVYIHFIFTMCKILRAGRQTVNKTAHQHELVPNFPSDVSRRSPATNPFSGLTTKNNKVPFLPPKKRTVDPPSNRAEICMKQWKQIQQLSLEDSQRIINHSGDDRRTATKQQIVKIRKRKVKEDKTARLQIKTKTTFSGILQAVWFQVDKHMYIDFIRTWMY